MSLGELTDIGIDRTSTRFHPDMQHATLLDPVFPWVVYRGFDPENLPRSCSNRDEENRSIRVNLGRIRRFTPKILGVKPYISSSTKSFNAMKF